MRLFGGLSPTRVWPSRLSVELRGIRVSGHLKMKLLKWVDGAGEPRFVKLFTDEPPDGATPATSSVSDRARSKVAGGS